MDSRPISRSTLSRSSRTKSKISSAVRDWPSFPNAIGTLECSNFVGCSFSPSLASFSFLARKKNDCSLSRRPIEQAVEIHSCGFTDLIQGHATQVGELFGRFHNQRRFVSLPSLWDG